MSASRLQTDLESDAFAHGVDQGFWQLADYQHPSLYVWMIARDNRRFLLRCECSDYGEAALLGVFVDPKSRQCAADAWPQGDQTFAQWVKFSQPDGKRFICTDIDRGGLAHHPDWTGRNAWKKYSNQLVGYLEFLSRLLRRPERGYEIQALTRFIMTTSDYSALIGGLRERSANSREACAILAGAVQGQDLNLKHILWLDPPRFRPVGQFAHFNIDEDTKIEIYKAVAEMGLSIIGTAHTHPEGWVGLSVTDYNNQLSSRVGVWQLIVPQFAMGEITTERLGLHIRMRTGWLSLVRPEVSKQLLLV